MRRPHGLLERNTHPIICVLMAKEEKHEDVIFGISACRVQKPLVKTLATLKRWLKQILRQSLASLWPEIRMECEIRFSRMFRLQMHIQMDDRDCVSRPYATEKHLPSADVKGRDQKLVDEHFERVGSSDEEDEDEAAPSTFDDDEAGPLDSDGLIEEDSDEEHQRRRARKQALQVSSCSRASCKV